MKSFCFTGALSTALLPAISSGAHAQIVLNLITQVDLSATASASTSPSYIGNNISAVAWNGSTAWVGGYNQGATGTPTAIVSVSNVLTTPLLGTSFGSLPTNNSRGITSLAINGNTLAAAYDNGSGNGDSVRSFDPTTNALNWRIGTAASDATRRRGCLRSGLQWRRNQQRRRLPQYWKRQTASAERPYRNLHQWTKCRRNHQYHPDFDGVARPDFRSGDGRPVYS